MMSNENNPKKPGKSRRSKKKVEEIRPVVLIEQDRINRAVWGACDTFRSTVDPSIYKDYVLTMLFLKYISDVWLDHYDSYRKEYGDHAEIIEEILKHERFVLPPEALFDRLHEQRMLPGNGARIDSALRALTASNFEKLRNVFQDIQFDSNKLGDEKQKDEILCHLLQDFAKDELSLRPSRVGNLDVIGNAYEFLIRHFASTSGKKAGEFYTPPEVSQLIALLVDPKPNDQICDPTCGSGSLLMKCGQLVKKRNGARRYALYGQEAIGSTWALAKMNMFLHGEDNHRIEWGDTLREPKLLNHNQQLMKFDVVVANPPFSLEKWGFESANEDGFQRFKYGVPPRTKADYAFILHMISCMKPDTGRMAVVVPNGVLFRGSVEGDIRRRLIDENLLETVIGLPEKLFYGTGIAAAILIFRSKKTDNKVLIIDASQNFKEGKGQNLLPDEAIELIAKTVQERVAVPKFAVLVERLELAENDFNLNITRYVSAKQEEPEVDLVALREERVRLKQELQELEHKLDGYLKELGVSLSGPAPAV
jgi:type I restriction enzyme M protein